MVNNLGEWWPNSCALSIAINPHSRPRFVSFFGRTKSNHRKVPAGHQLNTVRVYHLESLLFTESEITSPILRGVQFSNEYTKWKNKRPPLGVANRDSLLGVNWKL